MTAARTLAAVFLALAATGCGFKPIYATPAGETAALNQRIAVKSVAASDTIEPLVFDALKNRMALKEGESPRYELYVEASERAERLAVQIDATVTRYNYRLIGKYALVDLETNKSIRGSASAVTSYNIVSSQYSTLFAERTAQRKAAQLLAEEIERDLLIRFSEDNFEEAPLPAAAGPDLVIDNSTDLLVQPDPDAVPDPGAEQQ